MKRHIQLKRKQPTMLEMDVVIFKKVNQELTFGGYICLLSVWW
ncbi:hypothetical protein VHA_000576 [Grimontia hollisae CIP 101886]|uniref:Uncharacterized protein n=1 Tax=Grimontia hollisae CIP 101886 TaxID=675812 RepID=D0I4B1_GRIHO|nr:hypothetical protein VHA_000576 [Grimontia hollisae CIP 101886]